MNEVFLCRAVAREFRRMDILVREVTVKNDFASLVNKLRDEGSFFDECTCFFQCSWMYRRETKGQKYVHTVKMTGNSIK